MKTIYNYSNTFKFRFLAGLILLFSLGIAADLSAQDGPESCQYFMSYNSMETSYFEFPSSVDVESMSIADILKAKKVTVLKQFENCVNSDGTHSSQVTILNPDDIYEDWMPQAITTITDDTGIEIYDRENNLIYDRPLDSVELIAYTETEVDATNGFSAPPEIRLPTDSEVAQIESAGFLVVFHSENAVEVLSENRSMYMDVVQNRIVTSIFEEGVVINALDEVFTTGASGNLIPLSTTYRNRVTLASGIIGYQVVVEEYSNYLQSENGNITSKSTTQTNPLAIKEGLNTDKDSKGIVITKKDLSLDLVLSPNPVFDNLTITFPELESNSGFAISIIDLNGKLVQTEQIGSQGKVKISANSLSKGMYFLKAENTDGSRTFVKRFVKF